MKGNRIIVHALIKVNDKYLVIKRSENENVYPNYYDIPGGLVNIGELPREGVIRETKEEVNLNIIPKDIIHEDSNYDNEKDMIFIRLVYNCILNDDFKNIELDKNEHSSYKLIESLKELKEDYVPFLKDVIGSD